MKSLLDAPEPCNKQGTGAGRRYVLGSIPTTSGPDHKVVLCMCEMGNSAAASRATLLLEHFQDVEAIIMTGIAGGVPNHKMPAVHVRLGDIVVSDWRGVVQYDMTNLNEVTCNPRPPAAKLQEAVRFLEVEAIEGKYPWEPFIERVQNLLKWKKPARSTDILHSPDNPKLQIQHPKDKDRRRAKPRVFSGAIGSSNMLLRDPNKRDTLARKHNIRAIEMETSGIADATWNHGVGYFAIRGICDYCDPNKGYEWQEYAAVVASAYTRALLESMPGTVPKELLHSRVDVSTCDILIRGITLDEFTPQQDRVRDALATFLRVAPEQVEITAFPANSVRVTVVIPEHVAPTLISAVEHRDISLRDVISNAIGKGITIDSLELPHGTVSESQRFGAVREQHNELSLSPRNISIQAGASTEIVKKPKTEKSSFQNMAAVWKNSGVRLVFIRDEKARHRRRSPSREETDDYWQALGYYDFLTAKAFSSLSSEPHVHSRGQSDGRSQSELFLLELCDFPPDVEAVKRVLDCKQVDEDGHGCLLSVISITLSPAFYECLETHSISDSFRCIVGALSELRDTVGISFPFDFWGCLSGPDLVVTSLPANPLDLQKLHQFWECASRILLIDLPGFAESKSHVHVFSQLVPCLNFSMHAEQWFSGKHFRDLEFDSGMQLQLSLRVDPGHDQEVHRKIEQAVGSSHIQRIDQRHQGAERTRVEILGTDGMVWGRFSTVVLLRHFSEFVTLHRVILLERDYETRSASLIDGVTTISFPTSRTDHGALRRGGAQAWYIKHEVEEQLADIQEAINEFAVNFLSDSQSNELINLYSQFEASLYRQGSFGVGRSLFPFVRQLAEALKCHREWRAFVSSESHTTIDQFDHDFDQLVRYFERALLNRVEYRGQRGDPPVPYTLYHGLSKLGDSYSAVLWLTTQMLLRDPGHPKLAKLRISRRWFVQDSLAVLCAKRPLWSSADLSNATHLMTKESRNLQTSSRTRSFITPPLLHRVGDFRIARGGILACF